MEVTIERKSDFWWVVVAGKPSYPCGTRAEAVEVANALTAGLS